MEICLWRIRDRKNDDDDEAGVYCKCFELGKMGEKINFGSTAPHLFYVLH